MNICVFLYVQNNGPRVFISNINSVCICVWELTETNKHFLCSCGSSSHLQCTVCVCVLRLCDCELLRAFVLNFEFGKETLYDICCRHECAPQACQAFSRVLCPSSLLFSLSFFSFYFHVFCYYFMCQFQKIRLENSFRCRFFAFQYCNVVSTPAFN